MKLKQHPSITGLRRLIARLHRAEQGMAEYRKRHEQLLENCVADPGFDPLSCLPGLMWVQKGMEDPLKELGFERSQHVHQK